MSGCDAGHAERSSRHPLASTNMRSTPGPGDLVKDLLETDPDSLSTDQLHDRIIELQLFRARLELARAAVQAEMEARAERAVEHRAS
jgi:hypothetical protein